MNPKFYFYGRLLVVITSLTFLSFITVSSVSSKNNSDTCGSYRINVRTLTDSLAKEINYTPKRVEVIDLLALKYNGSTQERSGVEFNTYQVNCKLSEYHTDSNGDIYITAYQPDDSTKTIPIVLTNPDCSFARISDYSKHFVSIRNNFWLQTLSECKLKNGMYKVVGVGYYDKHLGQVILNPVIYFVKFW